MKQYTYNHEKELWVPTMQLANTHDDDVVALNPHEFNVRIPWRGPCIINMGMNGKVYPRTIDNIVYNYGEYYYDPTQTNFKPVEVWLQKLFPTSSLQKFRDIVGEIVYPLINPQHAKNKSILVNFIITSNATQKQEIMIQKAIIDIIELMFPSGTFLDFYNITDSKTPLYEMWRLRRQRRRYYWRQRVRIMRRNRNGILPPLPPLPKIELPPPSVDYKFKQSYVSFELQNFTNTRFITIDNNLAKKVKYDEFFKAYITQIHPKKTVKEIYSTKTVTKPLKLPVFMCFTKQTPIDYTTLGKMKSAITVLTVECAPITEFITKNSNEMRNIFQNWIIQGIIDRTKRHYREDIGFINAILGEEEVSKVPEQKMYFMH